MFFFSSRRRHTRWPRDWSSDVCSSDLCDKAEGKYCPKASEKAPIKAPKKQASATMRWFFMNLLTRSAYMSTATTIPAEIGRASCREKVDRSVIGEVLRRRDIE